MFFKKKYLLAMPLLALTMANFVFAHDTDNLNINNSKAVSDKAKEASLKSVMQGLLTDTQQLTEAMLKEDFTRIAISAKNIAEHPKPSMAIRKKIMKAMGPDMIQFKANDGIVHNAAMNIVINAEQKNIKEIGEQFNQMIGGCVSCHSAFKNKVSALFK